MEISRSVNGNLLYTDLKDSHENNKNLKIEIEGFDLEFVCKIVEMQHNRNPNLHFLCIARGNFPEQEQVEVMLELNATLMVSRVVLDESYILEYAVIHEVSHPENLLMKNSYDLYFSKMSMEDLKKKINGGENGLF